MRFLLPLLSVLPLGLAAPAPELDERASCPSGLGPAGKTAVRKALKNAKLIPDLIPGINPTLYVAGAYGTKQINFGTVFTTAETVPQPVIKFNKEDNVPLNTNYSVFMIDPDVPMQGQVSITFLHWYYAHANPYCVTNQSPQTVTFYESPTPASTTQHRYTFLVYREPAGYKPDPIRAQARPGFDVNSYTKSAGLKLVGANYFLEAITNT